MWVKKQCFVEYFKVSDPKRFGSHAKLLLVAVIAGFTVLDAVQFNCMFWHYRLDIGVLYTCNPTVNFSGSATLENITGVHKSGYSNDEVEFLLIESQELPFLPQGIVKFFKNMKALHFAYPKVLSISAQDLQPFPKLESFVLYGSNLPSIDGDLFSFNPMLQYIDLRSDKIQHIGQGLVTNLNHLRFLHLGGNTCIDKGAANRTAVVELAAQLPVLCPPLPSKCSCNGEIKELREENQKLKAAVEKRLLEIEERLEQASSSIDSD